MFVELVYDKRNVEDLPGAKNIILAELTKRVHKIFPGVDVRVKPMQANALNSDCTKTEKEGVASENGKNRTLSVRRCWNPAIQRRNGHAEVLGNVLGWHTAGQQLLG